MIIVASSKDDIDSVYDDERIYFIDTDKIRKIADEPKLTFALEPTDDPEKFVMCVTETLPRYILIKEAVLEGKK